MPVPKIFMKNILAPAYIFIEVCLIWQRRSGRGKQIIDISFLIKGLRIFKTDVLCESRAEECLCIVQILHGIMLDFVNSFVRFVVVRYS